MAAVSKDICKKGKTGVDDPAQVVPEGMHCSNIRAIHHSSLVQQKQFLRPDITKRNEISPCDGFFLLKVGTVTHTIKCRLRPISSGACDVRPPVIPITCPSFYIPLDRSLGEQVTSYVQPHIYLHKKNSSLS